MLVRQGNKNVFQGIVQVICYNRDNLNQLKVGQRV